MANVFAPLPVPADTGAGAWVDVSAMSPLKTINVDNGPFTGQLFVELSNNAQASAAAVPTLPAFQSNRVETFVSTAQFMRVRRQGGNVGSPTVSLGGSPTSANIFGSLVVPATNGVGAAFDLSGGGEVNTFQVTGAFDGQVLIELSEDGTTFSSSLIFTSPGVQTFTGTLSAARVRIQYQTAGAVLVCVGSGALTGGGGGGGGVSAVTGTAPIASSGGATPAISLNDTAVTPGAYTNANITVDQKGRLTAAATGAAGGVTSVSGTAPIASSGGATPAISLNDTAVTPGSFTNSAITVDQKGRITAAASGTVPVTNVTGTAPIASSGGATPAISIADTAVTPGSYTNSNITVDAKGRLTAAANGSPGGVTSVSGTAPIASSGGATPAISLNDTAVTPGSFTNTALTVDQKGRLTAAASGTAPVTNVTGTAPIASSGGATPAISIADTAVTPGSYTNTALTVDAKGRLTAAASGTAPVTNVTGTAPIVSSGGATPAISIADTAVTPGSYTNTNLTVDAKGRITAAASGSGGGAGPSKVIDATELLFGGNSAIIPPLAITQGTNFPVESLDFDVSDIAYSEKFPLLGYTSGDITAKVRWFGAATTNAVKWQMQLAAINSATGSVLTKSIATAVSTQTTVSGTSNSENTTTITITGASLDGAAANDSIALVITRIAASAEMSGAARLISISLSWS